MLAQTDPGADQQAANEQADFERLEAEDQARRYPYGRPEQDTGWYWEEPTWGIAA